jgi:hypothetical protein
LAAVQRLDPREKFSFRLQRDGRYVAGVGREGITTPSECITGRYLKDIKRLKAASCNSFVRIRASNSKRSQVHLAIFVTHAELIEMHTINAGLQDPLRIPLMSATHSGRCRPLIPEHAGRGGEAVWVLSR